MCSFVRKIKQGPQILKILPNSNGALGPMSANDVIIRYSDVLDRAFQSKKNPKTTSAKVRSNKSCALQKGCSKRNVSAYQMIVTCLCPYDF